MKALIISDKEEVIKLLKKRLEKEGFDIIIYRWLLKALDNIEEIHPDYIVLSAEEYPRHWKTLASFVQSGIGGNDVRFCLYNDECLNDEDKKKAEQLGVEFYSELREFVIDSEDVTEDKVEISETVSDKTEVENQDFEENEVPTVEDIFVDNKKSIEEISVNYSIVFTNPISGKFICGSSTQTSFDTFECNVDTTDLFISQNIKYVTISNLNNNLSFNSEVIGIQDEKISLKVLNYYES